jgi:hippurate hydrolase
VQVRPGAITAAIDILNITITGVAGHGGLPHQAVDPIIAASSLVMALQTLISRDNDALNPAVFTVGSIQGGQLATAIPETVHMKCALRTTSKLSREKLLQRLKILVEHHCASLGCTAVIEHGDNGISYPIGVNDASAAALVRSVALESGQKSSDVDLLGPFMFSEDFAFMQEKVPSCYFGIGNGPTKSLHDTGYDFNDGLLVPATEIMARIVAKALPPT